MAEKIIAQWTLELECKCPNCENDVDLLEGDDFWSGRRFQAGENGTDATRDVGVWCPECGHEFKVDFQY